MLRPPKILLCFNEKYTFLKAFIAILLYLDDVTNAYFEKKGLVISDRYFGEGMETNNAGEKVKKERKDEILFKN